MMEMPSPIAFLTCRLLSALVTASLHCMHVTRSTAMSSAACGPLSAVIGCTNFLRTLKGTFNNGAAAKSADQRAPSPEARDSQSPLTVCRERDVAPQGSGDGKCLRDGDAKKGLSWKNVLSAHI